MNALLGQNLFWSTSNRTGRIRGLIQNMPSLPKGSISENRNLPYVCRGIFNFRNIQSSQNCFLVFSKMTFLTYLSFSCFLTFFSQKLVIHSSFLEPKSQNPKKTKITTQILKLPDSWEGYFL